MSERMFEDHLLVDNKKYSRIRADSITLGTYGASSSPIGAVFGIQSIEPHGHLKIPGDKFFLGSRKMSQGVASALTTELGAGSNKIAVISAAGRVMVSQKGGLAADLAFGSAEISHADLIEVLNAPENQSHREWLHDAGRSAAVISKIYYCIDGFIEKTLDEAAEVEVTIDGLSGHVARAGGAIKATATSSVRLDLSPGTTIAYQISNVVWDGIRISNLDINDPDRLFTE